MAKNTDIIKNFELILMENADKQRSNLYSGRKPQISGNNQANRPLDVDKVISDVSRQIKALQSADCMKKSKSVSINLNKYKKSSFVPVNMLHGSIIEAIPQNTNTNKFETQYVSDTQLINIVQDAEELVSHRGMTQEFDTTFNTQELNNISPTEKQIKDHDDVGLNDENKIAAEESKVDYHVDSFHDENEVKEISTALEKESTFPIIDISLKEPDPESDIFEEDEDNNVAQVEETSSCADTQIPDNILVIEDDNKQTHSNDIQVPSSPVFNVKTVKKSSSPPPLVFDLESFEEFEKIALPIVEETSDKDAAKSLINSQILDKELVLQPERSPVFFEDEYQVSPVIEKSDDKFKFDEDVKLPDTNFKYVIENSSRQSSILKDEILFSSDEENECGLQQYCVEDLPFTCALATSFYEQPDVLDKTMFVGFQTASNKSIQICTESFFKAKSFLDDLNKTEEEKQSLAELVDMCDVKSTAAIEENIQNDDCFLATNRINGNGSQNIVARDILDTLKETTSNVKSVIELPTLKDLSEKSLQITQPFEGFKTASNKIIRLSEKALHQSKNIFKEIDFNETENFTDTKTISSGVTKENVLPKQTENETPMLQQEKAKDKRELNLDDSILLEFENNDMSHENIDNSKCQGLVGFRTASNKDILISDAAMEKSKKVFQDIDETDNINDANANTDLMNILESPIVGFKTASNKEIKISDQAVAKTKNIFQDIELNDNKTNTIAAGTHTNIDLREDIWNQPSTSKTPFVGFKTGNNKEIKISDAALAKTKKIFHDIDKDDMSNQMNDDVFLSKSKSADILRMKRRFDDINEDVSHNVKQTSVFLGFQTASNKRIKISDEALRRSRKIFDNLDQDDSGKDIIKKNSSNKESKGLQSISEEPVTVPKNSVEKTINIFRNIDENFNVGDSLNCNQMPVLFKGFQTASNKPINISEQALIKSNKIFEDMDKNINANAMKEDITFKGFQTASNKRIPVSEEALAKSKKIFELISVEEKDDIEPPFRGFQSADNKELELSKRELAKTTIDDIDKNKDPIDTKTETGFIGFKTASDERVNISAQALAKSRKIFEEINADKEYTDAKKNTAFIGFQTASNKRVNISPRALARSRKIFEEIDADKEYTDAKKNTAFIGFQTASNKGVNISPRALARSRNMFEEIDIDKESTDATKKTAFKGLQTASNKRVNISPRALVRSRKILKEIDVDKESTDAKKETGFIGFQTASNRKVNVSVQALARSRKIFENIDVDGEAIDIDKERTFIGFQTASNKKVKISEQALARSENIFENIDVEKVSVEKDSFQGFQTASNKKAIISEDSLFRSKKILENLNDQCHSNENFKKAFEAFQTASNKQVKFSEETLAKSRKISGNIDIENSADDVPITKTFQGFQTGNNKKVNVSEQALAKSRKLFEHIDLEKDDFEKPKGSPFKGFQTASNRNIKISKEALAKTKHIFQDVENIITEDTDKDPDIVMSQVIPVKGANNSVTRSFKDSFREPDINADSFTKILIKKNKIDPIDYLVPVNKSESIAKDAINLESVIDTQVMKNFNDSFNTEDLKATTPAKSKRSGSPILSCRKAKRRKKFETPYNKTQKAIVTSTIVEKTNKTDDIKQDTHIFDDNYKKIKKYNLKDVLNMEKDNPETQSSVDPYILEHTFENLLQFEFIGKRNDLSNERWTTEDLKKCFLDSVNKNFVPDGWLDNHLKLIIWKLISYEIKFPKTMSVVCTSRNVIEQLKYRYDRELFNSERPVLRKIMERDDVSTKLMVLCVVAVLEDGAVVDRAPNQKTPELLLTDGWYCIRASLDRMLSELVSNGKIAVGAKLATSGAELVGCDQGVAPWEDTSQIRLKLSGNSTRRARWDARLGYHGNGCYGSGAPRCRLRDAAPGGGRAARLRLLVTRVYPALYVDKFDDGSTVTRSERLELLHQMKYENERQTLLEKLYEEVQKEFANEDSQDSEMDPELKRQCLDSGSQIAKAMKMSKDPSEFRSHLTDTQLDLLTEHTTRKRDRLIQDIQARVEERIAEAGLSVARNVVPVLKVRVADAMERGGGVEVTRGLLSIWKPNDAITEIVKEGSWIEVMNVIPTAIRYSEIQISAGRQSVFTQSKYKESEKIKPYTKSMKRICYTIKDLARSPTMTTEYNEVDTVGIVVLIEPSSKEFDSKKNQFQNVYLADADKNLICVNFWGGTKKLGYDNILDTGQVVACLNLQKRAGNTRKSIPQYRVTEFSYFTKTPKSDEARSITDDLEKKLLGIDRIKFCDDCVMLKNNYSVYKMQNYNENVSPYRYQNVDLNLSKNRVFIDSPLIAKNVKSDENLNLSGLDFESTFKQVDTQEYSPRTMLRKRQVKEKLEKLRMYGEPPASSPMQILNRSKNAASAFKSPLPKSDIPTSVANVGEILPKEKKVESSDIEGSPVIMDRTFVKRINVNPVKLDFNSAVDESNLSDKIDHFAEEFDGSPPLSLD